MPPKRKSENLWQKCEKCNCIISFKDLTNHESECSLPNELKLHSFIQNGILHGYVEDIRICDLNKNLNPFKNELVFLSQSAMQVCGFFIGSTVEVVIGKYKLLKRAWPSAEGSLTSVSLSKEGFQLNDGTKALVKKLCKEPIPARFVEYTVINDSIKNLTPLHCFMAQKFANKILALKQISVIEYFGRRLEIIIDSYKPVSNQDSDDLLSAQLAGLELHNESEAYILCLASTKWTPSLVPEYCNEKIQKETLALNCFGGYNTIVNKLVNDLSSYFSVKGKSRCLGILLFGHHGVGKTMLTECLSNSLKLPKFTLKCIDLCSRQAVKIIKDTFSAAATSSPSVLVLDGVDCAGWGSSSSESAMNSVILALVASFDSISEYKVVVLATSTKPSAVPEVLRRPGRLEIEIEMPVPEESDRVDILMKHVSNEMPQGSQDIKDIIINVAKVCHGFVGADLAAVVKTAFSKTESGSVTKEDMLKAVSRVGASGMREVAVKVSPVRWHDIGGMQELKKQLLQAVDWPLSHPESLLRLGVKPPSGILMYGPPGCCKTMVAKALATETKLNFISIKGSDIFSKWVGESERSLKDVFDRARRVAPSIVFLDEIDALGASRGDNADAHSSGSQVHERVLSQLLTELDGVQPLHRVIIVAATNRPDRIDKALTRPGRLDRLIYVPLPDEKTRLAILRVLLAKTPVGGDIDVEEIASRTSGYSGAELAAVCNEAALYALEENMDAERVYSKHFNKSLEAVVPRTPQTLIELYENFNNKSNFR